MIPALPALGSGLGYREPFRADLFLRRGEVDFLEITADHFFDAPPEKGRELDLLAGHFRLIPHGLNLSLGSAEGIDPATLEQIARLIERLDPPWWSEHIAFTRAGGTEIGHLTPVPFSEEALDVLTANVRAVRERVGTPLILENITYALNLPGGGMGEAEFLSELLERADCGLLLDVTNLYINAVRHRYDPVRFVESLPVERIVQLHYVGISERGGTLVDDHAKPTPPEVWGLMEAVVRRAPVKGIVLERDEDLPPFGEILAEVAQARSVGKRYGRWA